MEVGCYFYLVTIFPMLPQLLLCFLKPLDKFLFNPRLYLNLEN